MENSKSSTLRNIALFTLSLGSIFFIGQRFYQEYRKTYIPKKFTGYKAVIYDLNGVLVKISKVGVAREVGFTDTLCYYMFDCTDKAEVQKRLFDTLGAIDGYETGPHAACGNSCEPMPALMCRWMDGRLEDPQGELKRIDKELERLLQEGFFKNKREYRVMKNTIHAMFHPHALNKHRKPIRPMLSLVHEIHQTGKYKQCVLSNWDKPSFNDFLTTKTGKTLTKAINLDDIIISADITCNKPHPDAFTHVLQRYNLSAEECIFIDDQLENVEAARKLGMHGIHVKEKNYKDIKKELQLLKVL